MPNTPHDEDPKRTHKPNVPPPAGKKSDDDSLDDLPPLDPELLESGELPELDPGLLESGELPAGGFKDRPDSKGTRVPDSGEVRYEPAQPGEPGSLDSLSLGSLPDSGEIPSAGLSKIPPSEEMGSGTDWMPVALTGTGESGSLAVPTADPASGMGSDLGIGSADLASGQDLSSLHAAMPSGTPGSGGLSDLGSDTPGEVPPGSGEFEPIAPAAGWLESVENMPAPPSGGPRPAAPAGTESSDIFGGATQPATPAERSDVIAATAHGEGKSGEPLSRASDVALSFDRSGTGQSPSAGGAADPHAATQEGSDLFSGPPAGLPFDSAKLADAPPLPDATEPVDVPEFGKSPEPENDASSILADLAENPKRGTQDSSAIRIDAPGVERTLSSDHGEGTEFDLTINDALPHELIAEAASDHGPAEWEHLPGPEMFDDKTLPEVQLGEGRQVRTPTPPPSASSIFSEPPKADEGSEVPLAASPAAGESDSSVEFSDHPEAEDEESASSIMGRASATPPPAGRPKSKSREFEAPPPAAARGDAGDSSILSRDTISKHDFEQEGTLPEGQKNKPQPPRATPAPQPKTPSHGDRRSSDPSVEIDWMASSASAELEAAAAPTAEGVGRERRRERPAAEASEAGASRKGAWIGGTLLGMVIAGGGFAGAYFGGLLPKGEQTAQRPGGTTQPGANNGGSGNAGGTPTAADAAAAIRAGDSARAKQIVEGMKDATPAAKALAGEAGLFALVQAQGTTVTADNADLKAARENLQAAVDDEAAAATPEGKRAAVKAAVQLGISHELAGDRAAAKKVYEDAKGKFPEYAETFDAALDRLAATRTAEPTSLRLAPADARQLLLAVTLLQADAKGDDAEAGVYFWKAVNKATGEKYAEAVEELKKAKAAHVKQAKAKAGAGLNPLSDPLEQIFPRCCDDLKAYWELRAAIYANRAVADLYKKEGAEKAFAELAAAQSKAADAVKLATNLKDATDKLTKANTDLTKANTDLKKAEGDLANAKAMVTTLQKDVEVAKDVKLAIEKKLDLEEKARKTAEAARADAETARAKSGQLIASLAKELQAAKLLPEKYGDAELLAALKRTAERATGPNLGTLLPSAMAAVGGSGLSAAQLVDIAERLTKAESAAKTAADRLAAETQKLRTDHAAELKKLTDGYAADLKKLTDAHTTEVSRLKDDQKAELKKASDQFSLDAKKLKDGFEGKVKDLESAVAAERERVATLTAQFKVELRDAISPSDALDLWLPLLTELRRPADADRALTTATKLASTAPAGSEAAAKAQTVAGLALLIKNDLPAAKAQLQAAKASPAHKPALAAKKAWASAADTGLASLTDPLAPYRQPVNVPHHDLAAAARALDAGVKAYREGRYTAAVAALGESVKADAANPVAWYYLGAARWALGELGDARASFAQGATREAASDLTTRAVNAAIVPIQGAARDALTAARP